MKAKKPKFTFEISLSVLNHLGRNLYRSFVTVLGEAISNSWDADSAEVRIYIDKDRNSFVIKDDGHGMTQEDFQDKFLRIGYSKRNESQQSADKERPYIGRKGIGKLALLSCADKITVISKVEGGEYVGGTIDNSEMDTAITKDLTPEQYPLGEWDETLFADYTEDHNSGTIIHFENIHGGIKSNIEYLRKLIALYFRFSLVDSSFAIFINDEEITPVDLNDLAEKTEFLWRAGDLNDPYLGDGLSALKEEVSIQIADGVEGFIASVSKPRDLSIITTGERISVDLFVNGRLRERDLLKHMPTARIAESYLYGQIHFNGLDDEEVDRFTSNRESVVADDPKYQIFLSQLQKAVEQVIKDWDVLRRKYRKDGNPEDTSISTKERKSEELYNVVSEDYMLPTKSDNHDQVDQWVNSLRDDAMFNLSSYAECFISENLVRKYLHEEGITISAVAQKEVDQWRAREVTRKTEANINFDIRKHDDDLSYLDMQYLAKNADPGSPNTLESDGKVFRPLRNSVMHTALITDLSKARLTLVFENIRARIKNLLS